MQQKQDEQKFKVMFGENKIIGGVMFGKGVYELTADRARACVREGGVMSAADAKALEAALMSQPAEGAPLSLEETMQRFAAFDFSDDVMRSMQYHQAEIQKRNAGSGIAATYGDKTLTQESTIEVGGGETSGGGLPNGGGIPAGNLSGFNIGEYDAQQRAKSAEAGNVLSEGGNAAEGQGNGEGGGNGEGSAGGGSGAGEGSQSGGGLSEGPKDNSDIPADFPARAELIAGGVDSLEKLRGMKRTDILALKDIGEAKTNQIGARLAAMTEENK